LTFIRKVIFAKKDNTNILIFSQKSHSASPYLAVEVPNLKRGVKFNLSGKGIKFIGGAL
jgi:hypothetical protein